MYDYLIVGQGLAGSMLAFELLKQKKTVFIIDQGSGINASRQAIGLINPITGKRFVKSWKTDQLLPFLKNYYTNLENSFASHFF
ncbi:MAG: hypothetical protein LRY27_01495 [Chitinophagales bacterium]|nr:hypothetical protein [Chitinophagales bacterium]